MKLYLLMLMLATDQILLSAIDKLASASASIMYCAGFSSYLFSSDDIDVDVMPLNVSQEHDVHMAATLFCHHSVPL